MLLASLLFVAPVAAQVVDNAEPSELPVEPVSTIAPAQLVEVSIPDFLPTEVETELMTSLYVNEEASAAEPNLLLSVDGQSFFVPVLLPGVGLSMFWIELPAKVSVDASPSLVPALPSIEKARGDSARVVAKSRLRDTVGRVAMLPKQVLKPRRPLNGGVVGSPHANPTEKAVPMLRAKEGHQGFVGPPYIPPVKQAQTVSDVKLRERMRRELQHQRYWSRFVPLLQVLALCSPFIVLAPLFFERWRSRRYRRRPGELWWDEALRACGLFWLNRIRGYFDRWSPLLIRFRSWLRRSC